MYLIVTQESRGSNPNNRIRPVPVAASRGPIALAVSRPPLTLAAGRLHAVLADDLVVLSMGADPDPGVVPAFRVGEGTIAITDSNREQVFRPRKARKWSEG